MEFLDTSIVGHDLIEYVINQHVTPDSNERIHNLCKIQPPKTITVYRGQNVDKIKKSLWFSTSISKEEARQFSLKTCCIFTIHLMNVPVIDINALGLKETQSYEEENEYIVLGGGTFYKDASMREKGFTKIGEGKYECWYSLINHESVTKKTKKSFSIRKSRYSQRMSRKKMHSAPAVIPSTNVERALAAIDKDEYDFIDNIEDINMVLPKNISLTARERDKILSRILKRKAGGTRKNKL
jgi:hypothetical protein